jgi:hypothetical protein
VNDEWTLDEFEQALEYLEVKATIESAAHKKALSESSRKRAKRA